jgi:predicted DNA binding CopG/RHH family protein
MRKKIKSVNVIDKEMEKSKLSDFDLDNAIFTDEKWNLEKSYPLNIRIQKGILAEAKVIAKEKGVPYQTLLKIYIADGLRKDKNELVGV